MHMRASISGRAAARALPTASSAAAGILWRQVPACVCRRRFAAESGTDDRAAEFKRLFPEEFPWTRWGFRSPADVQSFVIPQENKTMEMMEKM